LSYKISLLHNKARCSNGVTTLKRKKGWGKVNSIRKC